MSHYAVFLRGVNVGGIKVTTVELRKCLDKLGLKDVKTYLQTGNITCKSDDRKATLKHTLEAALSKNFSYDAKVIIYDHAELKSIAEGCPYKPNPDYHRYAILVSDPVLVKDIIASVGTLDPKVESVAEGPSVIYWRVPKGQTLKSSFAKVLAKKLFKEVTTTRNLNTLEKML